MNERELVSRRRVLGALAAVGGSAGVSAVLAACSAPAAPGVGSSPSAANAVQGAAPSPVTSVGPTEAPPDEATPAIGKSLIGTLEGPTVITDPAQYPKAFNEAPMLADLVKAGKLPALKDRLPDEPLVLKPVHEVGKYGGTWRRMFTGPGDWFNGLRAASGTDRLIYWDFQGANLVPNLAKSWSSQDGGRTLIVTLRKGTKWSDGQPFTTDDILFWFQDLYQNKDLVPTPSAVMSTNGKQGTIEKVDDYTVAFKFADPYYSLPAFLAEQSPLGGQVLNSRNNMGGYAPAHYLKQFHPKYVGQDKVDQLAKAAKYDDWVKHFLYRNTWGLNPELPTLTPWVTTQPINTPTWVLERNPYSVWVDTAGNQLPYIDKIQMSLAESTEVVNLHAIAGDLDFQERHMDLSKLPVLLQNQQKGGYKVYLDPAAHGCDAGIIFNMSYEDDPEIAKWIHTTDFRRSLALGIDRNALNQTFWLGLGTPGSIAPTPTDPTYPGDEYRTQWSTLDVAKANQMLDQLGLDKKDADGFRLRTDGKGKLSFLVDTYGQAYLAYPKIVEMITQQWKQIGIDARLNQLEQSAAATRWAANQHQMTCNVNDGYLLTYPSQLFPYEGTSSLGPLYGKWFASNGAQGKEPPAEMKDVMAKWRQAQVVPDDQAHAIGKEIWKILIDQQYIIGTVGLSPAFQGTRVAKTGLGNVPAREAVTTGLSTPSGSRPVTFYWKT